MALIGGSKSTSSTRSYPTVADNGGIAVGTGASYQGFTDKSVHDLLDFLKTSQTQVAGAFNRSLDTLANQQSQVTQTAASPAGGFLITFAKQFQTPIVVLGLAFVILKVLK